MFKSKTMLEIKSAVRESCRKLRKIALPQEQLPIVRLLVLFHEHAAALQPMLLHNWHFLLAVMPPSLPTKQPNHAQFSERVSTQKDTSLMQNL